MRITIPSGIAACLVMGILAAWLAHSSRTASAAERLEEAAQLSSGYQGWTHTQTIYPMVQGMQELYVGGRTLKASGPYITSYHDNIPARIFAEVREGGMIGKLITYYDLGKKEVTTYDAASGEVQIGLMNDGELEDMRRRENAPSTMQDLLNSSRKVLGREPFSLKETPDGQETRYEIVTFGSKEEQERFQREHQVTFGANRFIIWVGKDKLITRCESPESGAKTTFTYGSPEIHDIYDLGAPREAMVKDSRPQGELKAVMARLEDRAQKGLGDYVGLISQYNLDDAGQMSRAYGKMYLLGAQGDKWLAIQYTWTPANGKAKALRLKELPADWPVPDVEKLLPVLRAAAPVQYSIGDGQQEWSAGEDANGVLSAPILIPPQYHARDHATDGVIGRIWPWSYNTRIGRPGVESSLVRDAEHPNLIGLHTKSRSELIMPPPWTTEVTWWLDPARDDVPVEITSVSYEKDVTDPRSRSRTRFLEFTQLHTGQWYPARWQEERRSYQSPPQRDVVTEYRLQVLPLLRLGDEWFRRPEPPAITPVTPATRPATGPG